MNAVVYARYSSDNQREESIEGQLRECQSYAEKHGYTVIGELHVKLVGKTVRFGIHIMQTAFRSLVCSVRNRYGTPPGRFA